MLVSRFGWVCTNSGPTPAVLLRKIEAAGVGPVFCVALAQFDRFKSASLQNLRELSAMTFVEVFFVRYFKNGKFFTSGP